MRMPVSICVTAAVALAQPACHDLAPLDGIVARMSATLGLRGACLRGDQHGAVLHERRYGAVTLAEGVPLASATQNLSAVVLMSCVDSGHVRLDDRVSQYFPSWQRPDKQAITLRQCFTPSAGLPANDPAISDNGITLRQAVDLIAQVPLQYVPGTAFSYGGVSMHVAGAVLEVATGRTFAALVAERVATPCGMTATDYRAFGPTANPRIAGASFAASQRDHVGKNATSASYLAAAMISSPPVTAFSIASSNRAPFLTSTLVTRRAPMSRTRSPRLPPVAV